MGVMDVATIARSQDYMPIKHNENIKSTVDQGNFNQAFSKEIEHRTKEVVKGEKPEQQQKKFDAKEKGNGHYQRQKQNEDKKNKDTFHEGVEPKLLGGFDMKV